MDRRARIAPAERKDVAPLAAILRVEDVREIRAAAGADPEHALAGSLDEAAWAYTIYDLDGLLGMFGVTDWGGGAGCPWFLAAPRLFDAHRHQFVCGSRAVVRRMQTQFTSLENWVLAENLTSVRWLRWLGFTTHPAEPYGFAGLPFHRFTWRK